ncbi:porin PorA family protein [Nocardia asiatica]|uniref:porin PorA family protein n=1 Tax=Nocardia asiatica TaxID=209252 RepID=UPI0005C1894E|nr:porin PorA family protein [Nocardia asiatica]
MKFRLLPYSAIVAGVLCCAASAVLAFGIVPAMGKLPSNLDVTVELAGTASMLNSEAISQGDFANVIAKDVPITVQRHIYVSSATADTAIAHDDVVVSGPGGMKTKSAHTYAVDRDGLGSGTAPSGTEVETHTGLTVAYPANPPTDDSMRVWHAGVQAEFPMAYKGSDTVQGREVRRYTITASGPLKDAATAASLPPALPKPVVQQMLPILASSAQQALGAALPTAGEVIPLSYRITQTIDLGIDAELGLPLDGGDRQQIIAIAQIGDRAIDLMPVMQTDTKATEASVQTAADQAQSIGSKVLLIGTITPLVLFGIGNVLLVAGGVLLRRRTTAAETVRV